MSDDRRVCAECGGELPDGQPCTYCVPTIEGPGVLSRPIEGSDSATRERKKTTSAPPNALTNTGRFLPGAVFAERYRIVHRLGKGGMAEVYRAEDLRLSQTIALKFLLPSLLENPRRLERFRDEARLARLVSHPAVCRIYDFGEWKKLPYVAMEYVEGEHLASLQRRVGRLPAKRALEIALEICQGLGAIHEQGILHRDLKPANVMLDSQGRARILDFGLAALADRVSRADVRSGTPAYMAPEQARGEEVSVRSDLYSLGLVLRELWVGERLRTPDQDHPSPMPTQVDGIDPVVGRMIERCLAFDPERRPASAESVAAGLRQAVAFEPGTKLGAVVAFDPLSLAIDHKEAIVDLLESFGGQELWDAEGSLWLFEKAWDAVSFAVALRTELETRAGPDNGRLAMEVTEVDLRKRHPDEPSLGFLASEKNAAPLARALLDLAQPGQTLLSELVYHLARRISRTVEGGEGLSWLAHGHYRLPDEDEPVEVFEVGVEGYSPLTAPAHSETGHPAIDNDMVAGWRPAPGVSIPQRPNFRIERRAGEGGFGEVWLARHRKTAERRVFKFCFDVSKLHSLKREITVFRLLNQELGQRNDITRVLDWNFDQAPCFIESEYTEGGSLTEWAAEQGGIDRVPLRIRLELVAQVADALDAAHSVGVLHKDVKPPNVLITQREGRPVAQLTDFGIGVITDRERLRAAGITVLATDRTATTKASTSGTPLYLAPELLEGKAATLKSDIYGLGVMLYQTVAGDFSRALAQGWRREVPDKLLQEVIESAIDGSPNERFSRAGLLAERLRSLEDLRRERERNRQSLETAKRKHSQRTLALVVGAFVGVVLAGLAGAFLWPRPAPSAAAVGVAVATRPTIALLGFHNLSGRAEAAWLSTALSEMLATEVGAGEKLRVISGQNVARAKVELEIDATHELTEDSLTRIGKLLDSDLVVVGSYLLAGSSDEREIRLDLKIQNTTTREVVARLSERGTEVGVLNLVESSGRALRETLGVGEISPSEAASLRASHPSGTEATKLYAQGLEQLRLYNAREARDLLQEAARNDPENALIHSALATAWGTLGYWPRAQEEAKRAFELSTKLSRRDRLWIEARHHEVNRDLERAVSLHRVLWSYFHDDPEYALALARAQTNDGQADAALETLKQLRRSGVATEIEARIDLAEARAARRLARFHHQQKQAAKAGRKAEALGARLLKARAREVEASAWRELGDLGQALRAYDEARESYRAALHRGPVARITIAIAKIRRHQGRLDEASSIIEEALAVAREIGDQGSIKHALNTQAIILRQQGKLSEARAMHELEVEANRETSDQYSLGISLTSLGVVQQLLGDLEEARASYEKSLSLSRGSSKKRGIAINSKLLGDVLLHQGKLEEARRHIEEALTIDREVRSRRGEAFDLEALGRVALASGDLASARARYEEALAIRRSIGESTAYSLLDLANVALEENQPELAAARANEAAEEFLKQGKSDGEGEALSVLAKAKLKLGRTAAAEVVIEQALTLVDASEDRLVRLRIALRDAKIAAAAGREALARQALLEILETAQSLSYVDLQLEARLALGRIEQTLDPTIGAARLAKVAEEASAHGFRLIAGKAEKSLGY